MVDDSVVHTQVGMVRKCRRLIMQETFSATQLDTEVFRVCGTQRLVPVVTKSPLPLQTGSYRQPVELGAQLPALLLSDSLESYPIKSMLPNGISPWWFPTITLPSPNSDIHATCSAQHNIIYGSLLPQNEVSYWRCFRFGILLQWETSQRHSRANLLDQQYTAHSKICFHSKQNYISYRNRWLSGK
jgi:hypothetical protein